MTAPLVAMLFGLASTVTLHLAKGMQRHGIETLRWRHLPHRDRSRGRAAIYVVGVILNNLTALWIILANRFAPPAYATGMFGMGFVVLMLYSHVILREPVAPENYAGAALVTAGTLLFGFHALRYGRMDGARFDVPAVGWFAGIFALVSAGAALLVARRRWRVGMALVFGTMTGGIGSLDPVLKSLGQTADRGAGSFAGLITATGCGWIPFGISFVFGTAAFLGVQYAFLHGADASTMVPVQSSVYVLVPVLVQIVALPSAP